VPSKFEHLVPAKLREEVHASSDPIAPVIMCFEDIQYYDQPTFKTIKAICKHFSHVCIIRKNILGEFE
jgi:hypothetical protein